ncbi:MAG TPA: hypothetical protein VMF08_17225 [Candidatus Sulfotelmatobacter sp.]|nr:hypothetical protein [Candidatus Sulfotelmatobacter sp.]
METENSSDVEPPGKPAKKSGPESKVTVELVKRVSERVARGIPIRLALSGEPVTQTAYKKQLQRLHRHRSAGFQTCRAADFPIGQSFERG